MLDWDAGRRQAMAIAPGDGGQYMARAGMQRVCPRRVRLQAGNAGVDAPRRPFPLLRACLLRFLPLPPSLLLASCASPLSDPAARAHETPAGSAPGVDYFAAPTAAGRSMPFSEAVRVGDLLFVSGQIGNRPGTLDLVPGGIAAETRQTLENIAAILTRHGSALDRVVKCTVFLADMAEWEAMNAVYRTFFGVHPPARSALGAHGLALGARVEIECIATLSATGAAPTPR